MSNESNSRSHYTIDSFEIDDATFDSARLVMLKLYHSYAQTHAGYSIAITVALFGVNFSMGRFFSSVSRPLDNLSKDIFYSLDSDFGRVFGVFNN